MGLIRLAPSLSSKNNVCSIPKFALIQLFETIYHVPTPYDVNMVWLGLNVTSPLLLNPS